MEEDDKKEIKIEVMLEQGLNLYIICKLKNENLINENEYYYLKEKIENWKNLSVDMKKIIYNSCENAVNKTIKKVMYE